MIARDPDAPVLPVRPDFKLEVKAVHSEDQTVAVTLKGFPLFPAVCYRPNGVDTQQKVFGSAKRVGAVLPPSDPDLRREVADFALSILPSLSDPLEEEDVKSFIELLENSTIKPQRRKKYISAYEEFNRGFHNARRRASAFVKAEFYEEDAKCPRNIAGIDIKFTVKYYALIRSMEKKLFANPYFIKKVPVAEQPLKIRDELGPGPYFVATDFSSFECSFRPEVMEALECVLYRYMCSRSPWMSDLIEDFIAAITGPQVCYYPDLKYSVTGTRMSGDICTSLGNGFSNLVMNLFVASKCGASIKGFVEGDDGIFSWDVMPDVSYFTRMGFNIKLECYEQPSLASFCTS